jgi:hypothetical protein
MTPRRICVFCASSEKCDRVYFDAAAILGDRLARTGLTIIYGGGRAGLMGAVADAALAAGGTVIGVIPRFMRDVEWGHDGITELKIVDDMHERLRTMKQEADAFVALPGGCGTLDELFQCITWKRLGLHVGPIVMVNTRRFFDPCIELLQSAIRERFMSPRHAAMWTVVDSPEQVVSAITSAPAWSERSIDFARP